MPVPLPQSPPRVAACCPVAAGVVGFILMGSMHLAVGKEICHFALQPHTLCDLNGCDNEEFNHGVKFQCYL